MIDALLPLQALREHFAWPWMLLALPLPWLARSLLPAAMNTLPA